MSTQLFVAFPVNVCIWNCQTFEGQKENRKYEYFYNDHVALSEFCNLEICSVICVYELSLAQQS